MRYENEYLVMKIEIWEMRYEWCENQTGPKWCENEYWVMKIEIWEVRYEWCENQTGPKW